jgi:hypothetical protein
MRMRSRFEFLRQYHPFLVVFSPSFANQQLPAEPKALRWVLEARVSILCGCIDPSIQLLSLSLFGMNQRCMHDEFQGPLCILLSPILTCVPLSSPNQQSRTCQRALHWVIKVCVSMLCGLYQSLDSTSVCLGGIVQSCMHDEFEKPFRVP